MSQDDVRRSIHMNLKNLDSYEVIKHLNASFWKNVHDSWCLHLLDNIRIAYDLSNHTKVTI